MWPCTKERHAEPLSREEQVRCGYFCEQGRVVPFPVRTRPDYVSNWSRLCTRWGRLPSCSTPKKSPSVAARACPVAPALCDCAMCSSSATIDRGTSRRRCCGSSLPKHTACAGCTRECFSRANRKSTPRSGAHILWNKHRQSDSSGQNTWLTQLSCGLNFGSLKQMGGYRIERLWRPQPRSSLKFVNSATQI
jgi:hypothetical protein